MNDAISVRGCLGHLRRFAGRSVPGLLFGGLLSFMHHAAHGQDFPARRMVGTEFGEASYYGRPGGRFRLTASGQRFDPNALTGAHPWLPFGTRVRVTVEQTGRSVVVVITDRLGSGRRIIDLSVGAARKLGILRQGIAQVELAPA